MIDIVSKKTRSRMMSNIRSKDTKPEMIVRRYLHQNGFRYRLHMKDLPGKPDIVLPKYNVVIFVHGCFWHRHQNCKYATTPSTNRKFWNNKFSINIQRDQRNMDLLKDSGWNIIIFWECAIRNNREKNLIKLIETIVKKRTKQTSVEEIS